MIYYLASPYHLYTNPTLNSGTTRTDTVTGVGSIPSSGVLAVAIAIGIFASTANGYVQVYPAGATSNQYAGLTGVGTAYTLGQITVPVSAGGQITVKANGSNIVLQDWYIFGYVQ